MTCLRQSCQPSLWTHQRSGCDRRVLGPAPTGSLGQRAQAEAGAWGTPTLYRWPGRHLRIPQLLGRVVRHAVRPPALAHPLPQQAISEGFGVSTLAP